MPILWPTKVFTDRLPPVDTNRNRYTGDANHYTSTYPCPPSLLAHPHRATNAQSTQPTNNRMEEIRNKKTKGAATPAPAPPAPAAKAPAAAPKPPAAPTPAPAPAPVKSVPAAAETKEERESYDAYDVE